MIIAIAVIVLLWFLSLLVMYWSRPAPRVDLMARAFNDGWDAASSQSAERIAKLEDELAEVVDEKVRQEMARHPSRRVRIVSTDGR